MASSESQGLETIAWSSGAGVNGDNWRARAGMKINESIHDRTNLPFQNCSGSETSSAISDRAASSGVACPNTHPGALDWGG